MPEAHDVGDYPVICCIECHSRFKTSAGWKRHYGQIHGTLKTPVECATCEGPFYKSTTSETKQCGDCIDEHGRLNSLGHPSRA